MGQALRAGAVAALVAAFAASGCRYGVHDAAAIWARAAARRGDELVSAQHRREHRVSRRVAGVPVPGRLVAWGAEGRALATAFEVSASDRVTLRVLDADARYPVTIDSVLTGSWDALLGSDQTNALFGYSVARAGDVNGDGYDDVIVGARYYDHGEADEGAAFVFLGGPDGIANAGPQDASALLESNQAGAYFGWNVAGAGDVNGDGYDDVIVGARGYGDDDAGAAFVFLGSASGIASGNPATAHVAIQGEQAGAWLSSAAGAGDVNGDGYDDVIVGARAYDAGQTDEGAVFVFLGSANGIPDGSLASAAARIEADEPGALLGYSVAAAGDVNDDGYDDVIVGAPFYDVGVTDEGAAFVFLGGATGIASGSAASADAVLRSGQSGSNFGYVVSGAGDVDGDGYDDVIVGARFYVSASGTGGAAFVFRGSGAGIDDGDPSSADTVITADQDDAWLGQSVAGAGDVNADGYDDVLVGAMLYDAGQLDEGVALLFLGGPAGISDGGPADAAARLEANEPGAYFGVSVAGAGDVNGDGSDDVIIGSMYYDSGQPDAGGAFVYLPEPGLPGAWVAGAVLIAALRRRRLRLRRARAVSRGGSASRGLPDGGVGARLRC